MVAPISDETLMALADGELGAEEVKQLRARLARDPELAAQYALFVETRALAQVPAGGAPSAVGDPLAEKIMALDQAVAPSASTARGESRPRFSAIEGGATARDQGIGATTQRRGAAMWWRLPSAAALMFVLGHVTGYLFAPGTQQIGAPPTAAILVVPGAQAVLNRALVGAESGQEMVWSDKTSGVSGRVLIVSTHRLGDGTVCREYQISTQDRGHGTIVGSSCRRDGRWRTEIALTAQNTESGYTSASGMATVEDYLTGRGSSGPLTSEDERTLIDRGWQLQRD